MPRIESRNSNFTTLLVITVVLFISAHGYNLFAQENETIPTTMEAGDSTTDFFEGYGDEEEQQDYVKAENKVGGGIVFFSFFTGINAFYDFKLTEDFSRMINTQFIYDFAVTSGDGSSMNINRWFISADYRFPLGEIKNTYLGVGGGYGQSSLSYENTNTGSSYSAGGGGIFVSGEVLWEKYWKWQQNRQIFFNAGIKIGFYVAYNDNFDESQISDEGNHRDIANTGWTAAQQITHLLFGFGGTF